MRSHKIEDASARQNFGPNESAPFSLAEILVKMMVRGANRKARKNSDAVLAALIFQIEGEGVIHLCQLRQFRDFIYALRPFDAAIDFLQSDQISVLFVDDFRNAWQVKLLIHADADVNVVGHYPNGAGVGKGCEEKKKCQEG